MLYDITGDLNHNNIAQESLITPSSDNNQTANWKTFFAQDVASVVLQKHCDIAVAVRLTMSPKRKRRVDGHKANTLRWNSAPTVVGSAYGLLKTPGQRPLTVGSHCTGWATEGLALESLNLPHQHLFACDNEPAVEVLLRRCFDIGMFFREASHPDSVALAPSVDIYLNGWPCQPQSNMGNRQGPADHRSLVVDYMIQYLAQKRPRCFVLENVASALQSRYSPWMEAIMQTLQSIGESECGESAYEIFFAVCNSEDAGLPQRRKRLYIVGANKKFYGATHGNPIFRWPHPLLPRGMESVLDRREDGTLVMGDGAISDPSLLTPTAMRNLLNMETQLQELGCNPSQHHIIVDVAASPSRQHFSVGICPTITKQRGGCRGFYNSHLNRRLTVSEMIRLQGASPDRFCNGANEIGSTAMGEICGNAMSPPVVQRILQNLLPSVGLVHGNAW